MERCCCYRELDYIGDGGWYTGTLCFADGEVMDMMMNEVFRVGHYLSIRDVAEDVEVVMGKRLTS